MRCGRMRPHAASAACGHFLKKCGRMKKSAASAAKISGKLFNFSYYMGVFDTFEEFFESSLVIRSRNLCWENPNFYVTILSWKILIFRDHPILDSDTMESEKTDRTLKSQVFGSNDVSLAKNVLNFDHFRPFFESAASAVRL